MHDVLDRVVILLALFASLVLRWLVEVGNLPVDGNAVDVLIVRRHLRGSRVVFHLSRFLHNRHHALLLFFLWNLGTVVTLDEMTKGLVAIEVALFVTLRELLCQPLLLINPFQLFVPLFDLLILDL